MITSFREVIDLWLSNCKKPQNSTLIIMSDCCHSGGWIQQMKEYYTDINQQYTFPPPNTNNTTTSKVSEDPLSSTADIAATANDYITPTPTTPSIPTQMDLTNNNNNNRNENKDKDNLFQLLSRVYLQVSCQQSEDALMNPNSEEQVGSFFLQ